MQRSEYQRKLKRWQWRILLAFGLLYFFYYFGRENIGFIIPLLRKEGNWSSAQLGMVSSALFWTYALGQLFWGRLSDKVGGRLLCALGGLLSMGLNWICSFATSAMALAISWGLNGLAQSMGWAPGNRLIANWWPPKQRGCAIGVVLSFTGVAVIAVWLFSSWIGTVQGWKGLFRIPVLPLGVMSVLYLVLVRDSPQQAGLLEEKESPRLKGEEESPKAGGFLPYLNLLRDYRFDLACLTAGAANFARYSFTVWIPLYYSEVGGLSLKKLALVCCAFPAGMAIGPSVAGWISDRFFGAKRYPVIAIFLSISATSTFILGFVSSSNLTVGRILLFFVGFCVYGLQGPIYALSADVAGRGQAGTAAGIMDSASYMVGALQGMIIGAILTSSGGNWRMVFALVAAVQLAGVAIACRIKR